jgi:hypothetical protein
MKLLLKISFALLFLAVLTGCTSIEKQVNEVVTLASKVGNVDYERIGFWTDSDFEIYVMPDGTRKVHYNGRSKIPGGPQISITVEGIKDGVVE